MGLLSWLFSSMPQPLGKATYSCDECGKEIFWHQRWEIIRGGLWICPRCGGRECFQEKTNFAGKAMICDNCSNAYAENIEKCPSCGGNLVF